jgi:hypothetical protein
MVQQWLQHPLIFPVNIIKFSSRLFDNCMSWERKSCTEQVQNGKIWLSAEKISSAQCWGPCAAIGKKPLPGMHISNGSRDAQGRGTSLSSMECSDRQSKCPPIISASLAIWTSEAQMCCTSTLTQKRGTNAIITVRRRLNQERASPAMW